MVVKSFAERRMGGRYLKPLVIVAQDELLHADAEASAIPRHPGHFRRNAAARGEPYLIRRRIQPEGVAAVRD